MYAELTQDDKNEVDVSQFTDYENPAIPASKPEGSNHQVTNDWGAYRLIQATGLLPKHEYPKHLYFKYLQSSAVKPNPVERETFKDRISRNVRILLIDDNHGKGWKDSIEVILSKCLLADGCSAIVDPRGYAYEIDILLKAENGNYPIDAYDLVYLDLRLPKDSVSTGNPISANGRGVLEKIKNHNPIIPVIMFTASTKATNMDDLYEIGVDGYFVKESPETRNDPDFSKNNLAAFVKTTRNCLEKGALLKPYWKRIQEIKSSNLINGNDRTVNGQETKFEDRILERLTMFIGLLKKAYEQTEFDRNSFFYDQYETAFLTLWSVLNEISIFYFERTNDRGEITWKVINQKQETVFLIEIGYDSFCEFEVSTPSLIVRKLNSTEIQKVIERRSKVDYHNKLQIQMAFLIDKSDILREAFYSQLFIKYGSTYDPDSPVGKNMCDREWRNFKGSILPLLNEANKKRNKLNLTHASSSLVDYTHSLRQSSAKINNLDIDNLFRVVFFLATGVS